MTQTSNPNTSPDAPTTRARLLVAIGIAIAAAALAYYSARRPGAVPDFLYPWNGARLFLDGVDPYVAMQKRPGAVPPYDEALFYPFTALLALLPLARIPHELGGAIFFGLSSGGLAYVITRDGLWRVHVFMSASFVTCGLLVQFAPLLMTAAFVPALGFLWTLKPNLGLPLLIHRPTKPALIGCIVFGILSLIVFPRWPFGWLESIRHDTRVGAHAIPVLQLGGILLLLAVLRWRRAGGRLLLAMSLIPQQLFFYDQLPLWLIPRTRNESIALTGCSQLAFILYYVFRTPGALVVRSAYPYVIALVYLPALFIILKQKGGDSDEFSKNAIVPAPTH